jgi:hypothetical protein
MSAFRIARSLRAADFACDEGGSDSAAGGAAERLQALKALKAWDAAAASRGPLAAMSGAPHQELYRTLAGLSETGGSRQQDALPAICRTLSTLAALLGSCLERLSAHQGLDDVEEEELAALQDLTRQCIFWCGHGVQAVEVGALRARREQQQQQQQQQQAKAARQPPAARPPAQKHLQAAPAPAGLQQAAGWTKARAACLEALADVYTAVLELPAVLPGVHDRLAADEVRRAVVASRGCPLQLRTRALPVDGCLIQLRSLNRDALPAAHPRRSSSWTPSCSWRQQTLPLAPSPTCSRWQVRLTVRLQTWPHAHRRKHTTLQPASQHQLASPAPTTAGLIAGHVLVSRQLVGVRSSAAAQQLYSNFAALMQQKGDRLAGLLADALVLALQHDQPYAVYFVAQLASSCSKDVAGQQQAPAGEAMLQVLVLVAASDAALAALILKVGAGLPWPAAPSGTSLDLVDDLRAGTEGTALSVALAIPQALQACFGSSKAAVRKQLLDVAAAAVPPGGTLAQQRAGLLALLAGEHGQTASRRLGAAGRVASAVYQARGAAPRPRQHVMLPWP